MSKIGDVKDKLLRWLVDVERVVVVGIGNEFRKDDFVGVEVVRGLKAKVPECVMLIESETGPESFIESIVDFKPTHALIVDAGLLGLEPGSARFLGLREVLGSGIGVVSSHFLPLGVFCGFLKEALVGLRVGFLVVEPRCVGFGEGLSVVVEGVVEDLVGVLVGVFSGLGG